MLSDAEAPQPQQSPAHSRQVIVRNETSRDVLDAAAGLADQVVVVATERLVQFVASFPSPDPPVQHPQKANRAQKIDGAVDRDEVRPPAKIAS